MSRKMSLPTAIVMAAQRQYPKMLAAAVAHIGVDPPYGKEKIDSRTYDQRLVRMLPEQLAAMAQSDPQGAQQAQQRLGSLQERADSETPLPGQGTWEGES